MLAAHDDGFFRTSIHTESTVNAAHHIDVEPEREFFDFGIRVLARFDVDTLGGTDRRAHVTRHAFQASVIPDRQNVCAAKPFRIWTGLLWIIDCWCVAFEQTREEVTDSNGKSSKRGPNGCVLPAGSLTDIDDRHIDCVATLHRSHRRTSCGVCTGVIPSRPIESDSMPE